MNELLPQLIESVLINKKKDNWMKIIKHNPYRIVGLLIGSTEREKQNQISRLKTLLEAEQEPEEDFSLQVLGSLNRTVDSVTDAAAKLNLDSDKMSAALFWFYKGNAITDEPAFDSLKEGDEQSSTAIWTKLTGVGEVTQRNSSAFQNLSTLLLCNAFNGSSINASDFEHGISLKLKFLESDFVKDLKALATAVTYKTSKKELQLLFLNQVQYEVDKNGGITSNKFLGILNKQEFSAKEDFLKSFVLKHIEKIEKKIELAKAKRKANKTNSANVGKELYEQIADNLSQLKNILGTSHIKFSSISDKVSDEILQCGIDYFSHNRDSNIDPGSLTMDLFRKANALSIGSIAKQRCQENTEILQEWIDENEKFKAIKPAIDDIQRELIFYGKILCNSIKYAKELIIQCKSSILEIKKNFGNNDSIYLSLSSAVVEKAQNILITLLNEENSSAIRSPNLKTMLAETLDIFFMIGKFDMNSILRLNYESNLAAIKSNARNYGISTLNPKERLQQELIQSENELKEIQNKIFSKNDIEDIQMDLGDNESEPYFKQQLDAAHFEMNKIKKWKFLRSQEDKETQINTQQKKINIILEKREEERIKISSQLNSKLKQTLKKSKEEKLMQLKNQEIKINEIKVKLHEIDF